MTISSTASRELSIDTIVRRDMQLAGLMEPSQSTDDPQWLARSAMARDFIESDVEHVQTVGLLQRAVDFYEVTLVAEQATYTLPSTTLDVLGTAMYAATDEDTQVPLSIIDRDRYQRISDKTSAGRPTMYYPHRSQSLVLYVWPVPATADLGTLTLQIHKALATATEGSATLDFERFWTDYFQWSLAHKMALASGAVPLARCTYFKNMAEMALERCRATSSKQFAESNVVMAHATAWTR